MSAIHALDHRRMPTKKQHNVFMRANRVCSGYIIRDTPLSFGSMSKKPNPFLMKPNDVKRSSLLQLAPLIAREKRLKIVAGLATHGISKTGLATVLKSLNEQGLLTERLCSGGSSNSYGRQVRDAVEDVPLHATTPYGPLIQSMAQPMVLHYVNPFALLYHLSSSNLEFFNLLKSVVLKSAHQRVRVCFYVDEINPGNPLAPDPQLLLQATYWTILDFPDWFLRRKDSWFCFSLTRTRTVKLLPGYVSEFMKVMLRVFFPPTGVSFHRGCHIKHGEEALVLTADFAGFIADEKGLKEIFDIKGQAGNLCCISCLNIRNRKVQIALNALLQHFWDPNLKKRVYATDAHLRLLVAELRESALTVSKAQREKLETKVGVNYNPTGILFDDHLMTNVIHPITDYIRDSMHTLSSNGVAGTHLALMCQALGTIGCKLEFLQCYSKQFTLPRSRNNGKVSDMYFKTNLMETDHVRHFASDVLGMVPLLFVFLIEKIQPRGLLRPNIRCFALLHTILCILRRGVMNASIHAKLLATIIEHNTLFLQLYGETNAKIKFHHLYHLPDDLLRAGSAISCFVTERKNKDAIAVSVCTDRNVEKSSIIMFLHRTIAHWSGNYKACAPVYLRNGHNVEVNGDVIMVSKSVCLPCGDVYAGDMVLLTNGSIGQVMEFWQNPGDQDVVVRFCEHKRIEGAHFDLTSHVVIDSVDCVVEPMAWFKDSEFIVVCLPLLG
jgi:hypothetical protein